MRHTLSIACWMLASGFACATHLRGGEITLKKSQCGTAEYDVIVTIYTNSATTLQAGGGTLSFGDGSSITLPPLQNAVIDAPYNIGKAVFTTTHIFDKPGTYLISYLEPNRNSGIVNMQGSVGTQFYIETQLIINPSITCNHPPQFNILPIDKACPGKAFYHNPGASDPDGDSLSYEIVTPKQNPAANVNGFLSPNNGAFYSGLDYLHANESASGVPAFQINALNGDLLWDAPGMLGQYEIAIKVTEWKKSSDQWINLGYIVRDMQIIVEDCHNSRPVLAVPQALCVNPGDNLSYTINGSDPDGDPVIIEVFTADNYGSSLPVITKNGTPQPTSGGVANIGLNWIIACDQVRDQPYQIVFKITDQPASGVRLITFYTWTVSVVGAAPQFSSTTLDLNSKAFRVEWNPYGCAANAPVMEVWRRVGESGSHADKCTRGLSRSQGFEKIAEVRDANSFVDKAIDPGAKYCYRLVALFEQPYKSRSAPSDAACVGPIVAYAPVLTNVSVLKTDNVSGEIMVKWTSPFQIDKTQFPPPYVYDIFRTSDGKSFLKVAGRIADTTFVDHGINTATTPYGYKAVVYSPSGITHENPVDTSALGYYPRLDPKPQQGSIYLQWNVQVPWSNQSDRFPWHYIYRKGGGTDDFVLIDSIDVKLVALDAGFEYTDNGDFRGQKLKDNIVYRYKIQARGVYGNPRIHEPLINFSNESDAQMSDVSPPCKPLLSIDKVDCETFVKSARCDFSEFRNTITWTYDQACGNDVDHYRISFRKDDSAEFKVIAATSSLTFLHDLTSFSGCYKIDAVDRSGNVGAESDVVCNENCPNVFIPNVFTPENQDGINDFFPGIATNDPNKCPRFVKMMDIQIYDRWGGKVYSLNTPHQDQSLEWNGRDASGKDLPAGVYYYIVEVDFDAMDQASRKREIRGWVNLIR